MVEEALGILNDVTFKFLWVDLTKTIFAGGLFPLLQFVFFLEGLTLNKAILGTELQEEKKEDLLQTYSHLDHRWKEAILWAKNFKV